MPQRVAYEHSGFRANSTLPPGTRIDLKNMAQRTKKPMLLFSPIHTALVQICAIRPGSSGLMLDLTGLDNNTWCSSREITPSSERT